MNSRKNHKSLSARQIHRKVAAQEALFYKEVQDSLLKHGISCKDNDVNDKKVDDATFTATPSKNLLNIDQKSRVNFDCLLNHLCEGDSDGDCEKILEDFEQNLPKETVQTPEQIINDLMDVEDDSGFDFFDVIKQMQYDKDELLESEEEDYYQLLELLDKKDPNIVFMNDIRALCIKFIHTVPHTFINELLAKLRKQTNVPFPKDARTFLKTPRECVTNQMGDGEYCHYGIESAVRSFLTACQLEGIDVDEIRLIVNIDGARIAESSEDSAWIIAVSDTILDLVEVVGIYKGEQKPKDSNVLVDRFVEELTHLIENGIMFDTKMYKVVLHCLVCDAPAKAYIMKTKLYSGYFSCSKCTIEGAYEDKLYFPTRKQKGTVLRTDDKFRKQEYDPKNIARLEKEGHYVVYDEFQVGETIMKNIPNFNPITEVVLDYMHLILLGVVLKLLELWIQNPKVLLSEYERKKISDRLLSFDEYMPSDFSRNPRQLKNVRRLWKAHELRTFLLYTGPTVLYKILPEPEYRNFLCLHVAISILVNPILCEYEEYINYAEDLLTTFVNSYEKCYGEMNMVFNVHNVLHLVDDVRRFGCLDNFSAFRFENHIRKVMQLIRKGDKVLQQIANRLMEVRAAKEICEEKDTEKVTDFFNLPNLTTLEVVKMDTFKIDCRNEKDKYVLLDDGTYLECQYFIKGADGEVRVVGCPLETVKYFYDSPMPSDILNINIIQSIIPHKSVKTFLNKSILAKVCKFPFMVNSVAVPIIHTYRRT